MKQIVCYLLSKVCSLCIFDEALLVCLDCAKAVSTSCLTVASFLTRCVLVSYHVWTATVCFSGGKDESLFLSSDSSVALYLSSLEWLAKRDLSYLFVISSPLYLLCSIWTNFMLHLQLLLFCFCASAFVYPYAKTTGIILSHPSSYFSVLSPSLCHFTSLSLFLSPFLRALPPSPDLPSLSPD